MGIKLRDNETIKIEVKLHWSAWIRSTVMGGFCMLAFLMMTLLSFSSHSKPGTALAAFVWFAVGSCLFGYKYLKNKNTHYVLTNDRLYVEEGILSKSKKDVPIQKMNDVELSQGFMQRLYGSGNILVLTGNDRPTVLRYIEKPEEFKHQLTEEIRAKSTRVA
jgi:uncharacterized membrane protein YdbT with pleckstrin-like domain